MTLLNLQCALAGLFTSGELRDEYAGNATGFAERFMLSEREAAQLEALACGPLAAYATTLVRKRRGEVARQLPDLRAELGAAFAAVFDEFALRTALPDGPRRYAKDAKAFLRYVRRGARERR